MDTGVLKKFLLHHIEKVVLVPVLMVSGWLLHRGLQQESILDTHRPERLILDAKQLRVEVDQDHNDVVLAGRESDFKIPGKLPPIDETPYISDDTLAPEDTFTVLRDDPQLYAPIEVQTYGVLAPMAFRSPHGDYELRHLLNADPIKVTKQRPNIRRVRRARAPAFEEEMDASEESGLFDDGGEFLPDMSVRRLRDPLGVRPTKQRGLNNAVQFPVPGTGWFIAGTAAMPYKTLLESYEHAFALAGNFDPEGRDQPKFLSYQVQRADVTDKSVDQLAESDWVLRDGRRECIADAVLRWCGFAPEIVPVDYRADTTLTMWIPPVMLTDYSLFSLHPRIPMKSRRELAELARQRALANRNMQVAPEQIEIRDARDHDDRDQADQPWQQGPDAGPPLVINPPDYKLIRFYDFADDAKDPNRPRPFRKYVYRVRVVVEDPNFPRDPRYQPKFSNLAPYVYKRIKNLVAQIESAKDPWATRRAIAVRLTQWSKPSAPVSLPRPNSVYVGPTIQPKSKLLRVGNRVVSHQRKPPTTKLVVSQFKPEWGTRLSMPVSGVMTGNVLATKADSADIVDPITLKIKKLPGAEVTTDIAVIDIDGGHPLGIHEEDGLTSPSIMLLFDPAGGLQVRDEIDDYQNYRMESFSR